MLKLSVDEIVARIVEQKQLSPEEIHQRINRKLDELSGLISREGAAHIIANQLGIKLFDPGGKLQIKNIVSGQRNVDTIGKVMAINPVKDFTSQRGPGKVGSVLLADETGQIRVVFWNEQADKIRFMKEGDILKVQSGYVRDNNGRLEIQLNDRSHTILNPPGETVKATAAALGLPKAERKGISELTDADATVEILGTIVQVFDPRFFEVCPQCQKRAKARDGVFACDQHGAVTPDYSYVLNLFLDDGTDNIRAVFFRNQAERLLGLNPADMVKMREQPGGFEDKKTELLGNVIKVIGRVSRNQMFDRLELIANQVFTDVDPQEEISRLQAGKPKAEPQQASVPAPAQAKLTAPSPAAELPEELGEFNPELE